MSITVRSYLLDMRDYAQEIAGFVENGREHFMLDRKTQYAVIRAYEVIGEIAKRLPEDVLMTQPQIAWRDIKEFRDFLAHNYHRVRLDIVWEAVEKLPQLQAAIAAMLSALEQPGEPE